MAITYRGRKRKFVEREHPRNPNTGEFVEKSGAHASWLMRIANRTQGPNLGGGMLRARAGFGPAGTGRVAANSLKQGDHAKVVGVDASGKPMTLNGYVQGASGVNVRQRGRKTPMIAVQVAETPSGGGANWRGTVYVEPSARVQKTSPKAPSRDALAVANFSDERIEDELAKAGREMDALGGNQGATVRRMEVQQRLTALRQERSRRQGVNSKDRDLADVTAMTPEQLDDELARLGGELDRMGGNARGSAAWNNAQGRMMLVRQEKARRVDDAQRARDASTVQARISADIARQRGEGSSTGATPWGGSLRLRRLEREEAERGEVDTPRVKQDDGGMAPTTLATQSVKLHEVKVGDRMQYGVEKDRVTPKYHTVTEASSDERFTRIKLSDGTVFSMARVADIDIVKRSGSAPASAPTPAAPTAPAAKPITGMIKDAASRIAKDYPAATRETPHWSGTPQMSTVNALHAVADRFERGAINKSEAMSALNRLSINLARSPEGGEVAKLAKALKKAPARAPKGPFTVPESTAKKIAANPGVFLVGGNAKTALKELRRKRNMKQPHEISALIEKVDKAEFDALPEADRKEIMDHLDLAVRVGASYEERATRARLRGEPIPERPRAGVGSMSPILAVSMMAAPDSKMARNVRDQIGRATRAAGRGQEQVDDAVKVLKTTDSRDEARRALDGLTVAQLKQVYAGLNRTPAATRKADMVDRLIHTTVGSRINSQVLRGDGPNSWANDTVTARRAAALAEAEKSSLVERLAGVTRTDASVNEVAAKATFTPVRDPDPTAPAPRVRNAYELITKRATLLSILRQRGLKAKRGAPDDDLRKLLAEDDERVGAGMRTLARGGFTEGLGDPTAPAAPERNGLGESPGAAAIRNAVAGLRQSGEPQDERLAGQLEAVARRLDDPNSETTLADALAEIRIMNKVGGPARQYGATQTSPRLTSLARKLSGLSGSGVAQAPRESVADAQTVESLAGMKRAALLAVRRNTPGARTLRRGASEREIAEEIVRARNAKTAADRADMQAIMTADLGKAPAAPNTVLGHGIRNEHIGATVRFTVPDRFGRTDKDKTYESTLLEARPIDGQQMAVQLSNAKGSVWMPKDTPIEILAPRPDTPEHRRYAAALEKYHRANNAVSAAKYANTRPTQGIEEMRARGDAETASRELTAARQALVASLAPSAPARTPISDNDLAGDIPAAVNRLAAMTPTEAKKLLEAQRIGTLADLARQLKVRVEPTPKSLIKNIQSGLKVERLERMQQRTPSVPESRLAPTVSTPAPSTPAGMSPLRLDAQIDAAERLIAQTRDALTVAQRESRGGMLSDREIGLSSQLQASERKLRELRAEKAKRVGASPVAVPEAPAGPDTLPPALPWRPRDMSTIEARRNAVRDATMFRTDFDALPEDRRQAILTELRQVVASGDTQTIPSNRTSMGTTIRGAEAPHVAKARGLLNNFLAVRAAPIDNTIRGRAARLREGDRYALEGATIAELGEIAEVAQFRRPGPSWKRNKAVEYLRNRAIVGDKMPTSYRPIQMAETMRGMDRGQALALLDYVEADFGITKTDMKEIARELGVTLRNGDKRAMMHALSAAAKDAPGKA